MFFHYPVNLDVVCVIQGPCAEKMMHAAMERGQWVFFQNCHLAPSWMPALERLIENIDPEKVSTFKHMYCTPEHHSAIEAFHIF